MITQRKWVCSNGELFSGNNKKVVPKRKLFQVLSQAHGRISHRGQEIMEKWLQEIMQKSAKKLSTHPFHAQKMPNNQWHLQHSSLW